MNRSSRWAPWTWCRSRRAGCVLRRGHWGRHLSFSGFANPRWFDTDKEGTP